MVRIIWLFIAISMVAGCRKTVSQCPEATDAKSTAVLDSLARKLLDEKDCRKQVTIRREIYHLGKPGIDFLVEGVVDPKLQDNIIIPPSDSDSFHVQWRNGPQYFFVDTKNGATIDLTDLTAAMDARLLHDDDYLDRFVTAFGEGMHMEECVDILTEEKSTPASRRIAHRYLRVHEKLNLGYDPTLPPSKMPLSVRTQLSKWKKEHYEGSSWQWYDDLCAESDAEMNPPPLNITATDVPEPKNIPFTEKGDRTAYIEFYRAAYLVAANQKGCMGMTCCLGETPNRKAKVTGHYAGVDDANKAKVETAKRKLRTGKRVKSP